MNHDAILITVGGLLLAGLAIDTLGRRTRMPRVTLLVLFGFAVGPAGLHLLPPDVEGWYPFLAEVALVMIAFLLGGQLTRSVIARDGRSILGVSIGTVLMTVLVVGAGLWALGFDPLLALAFAGIATATDPAATEDVVRSSGASGPFVRTLRGVVAIDDAWGLLAFSLLLAAGQAIGGGEPGGAFAHMAVELGGAALIGLGIGLPAAYLTGRLKPGEPSLTEALGVVFLCGGLALAIGASFLLTAMIAGVVIANLARHHTRPFHEIENIEWPFMVLFFIFAGAALDIAALPEIGLIGFACIGLRVVGRVAGGWIGGAAGGLSPRARPWIGLALMPQAGVAMGMALIAANAFPEHGETILAITIATTAIFELFGPLLTQLAISRAVERDET